jgi:hypothetical protein
VRTGQGGVQLTQNLSGDNWVVYSPRSLSTRKNEKNRGDNSFSLYLETTTSRVEGREIIGLSVGQNWDAESLLDKRHSLVKVHSFLESQLTRYSRVLNIVIESG